VKPRYAARQPVRRRRLHKAVAMKLTTKITAWLASAAALAAVFMAYLNPHVVVDLANRVWACF
jgi:hypothetical protein